MTDPVNQTVIEKEFVNEVLENIKKSKKIGYNPTYFSNMITENGALTATRILIRDENEINSGFIKLWELKSLELSIEATVLKSKFKPLFSMEEIAICERRLKKFGYDIQK